MPAGSFRWQVIPAAALALASVFVPGSALAAGEGTVDIGWAPPFAGLVFALFTVGGGLTLPFGDPPPFLGFLRSVPFFWPTANRLAPMLVTAGSLLVVSHIVDRRLAALDGPPPRPPLRVRGVGDVGLLGLVLMLSPLGPVTVLFIPP